MPLFDSHAHLTFPELIQQIDDVIARASDAGVDRTVTVGTDLADARAAIAVAERFPEHVRAAVGFHPHEADKVSDSDLSEMATLLDHELVVGFGEMGLDFHYDFGSREGQDRVFVAQLRLAAERDLPVIIHARESIPQTVAVLAEHGLRDHRVVFHCFTGTADEARLIADHGWRISFTGIVTFPKSDWLHEIARDYPADQLMIETDSPYLSPVPLRGKHPNEPARVAHVATFLAELRGVDATELARQTFENTCSFFDWR